MIDDEELRVTFSKNIKSARLASKLTQEVLAEKADISLNFLKDIESGRSGTSLTTLVNLSHALHTTPNELLKDFFKDSCDKSDNMIQQINLLNDYQKDAVYTLIQYFRNNEMHN